MRAGETHHYSIYMDAGEFVHIKAVILRDYATAMLSVGENEKAVLLYEQSLKQWQATANTPEEARTAVFAGCLL